jgi:hypothetical protein
MARYAATASPLEAETVLPFLKPSSYVPSGDPPLPQAAARVRPQGSGAAPPQPMRQCAPAHA